MIVDMKETKRLIWADALRGLLIIIVVIGHSLQFGDYENRLAWNIIYSFHMAAFFLISGFVGYKPEYRFSYLKQKAQQLLLPFFSWAVLTVLLKGKKMSFLWEVIISPDKCFWFLFVLFWIIVLFVTVSSLPEERKIYKLLSYRDVGLMAAIVLLLLIMVLTEFRYLGFQFFALYFGFYTYGYWIRKFNISFKPYWVFLLGIVWIVLAMFWRMHAVPAPLTSLLFLPSSLIIYSYRYVTAFVGAMFCMVMATNMMNINNKVLNVLCYFGRISLGIYVIHLFIGDFVSPYVKEIFKSDISVGFVFTDFISRLVISTIAVIILQKIPYVRLFMLGKV